MSAAVDMWRSFEGELPRGVKGLGDTPVHHQGAWWVRHKGSILRAATPGFGDAAAFAQALTNLQNQVGLPIQAADTYLSSGESDNALTAYKAAGQTAVTTNGPEIDKAGAPNVTQSYTQFAWGLNGQLAASTDATAAQGLAHNILTTLTDAINQGQASLSTPAPTVNSDLQTAAQNLLSYLQQNGVPPESQKVPIVGAFQTAYVNAGNSLAYGVDQQYGPATASALSSVLGSPAPAPNPGGNPTPPGPGPSPGPSPGPNVTPSSTASSTDYTVPILVTAGVLAVAIVGGALYMKHRRKRGK